MFKDKTFEWAVVGAGPAGIATVGELLDSGVSEDQILWVDPSFCVGDFGKYWKYVRSNTAVSLFLAFLNGYESFQYKKRDQHFPIEYLDKEKSCEMSNIITPLQWISDNLCQQVETVHGLVDKLFIDNRTWVLCINEHRFHSEKVVLAIGGEVKDFPECKSTETIDLQIALNPKALAKACDKNDSIAVFGSSHSSMFIIEHLDKLGVKEIVNFYLSPIRYAVELDGWTLYDNTGLKQETAAWARENISRNCLPNIHRYYSSQENIQTHIKRCNKAIYGVGFQPRSISVEDISLTSYDKYSGILAPGLFGAGIGFPLMSKTPLGHEELNIGLCKFMKDIRKVMPIWRQYSL